MNHVCETPSAQVRAAAVARVLPDTGYYDLLNSILRRAKGVAGLIGSVAFDPNNMKPEDVSEAGYLVADELETALTLLDGLFGQVPPEGKGPR
jgi:hypothetical protein